MANEAKEIIARGLAAHMEAGFPDRVRQSWEASSDAARSRRYAEAVAILAALDSAGLQVVPVDPTSAMTQFAGAVLAEGTDWLFSKRAAKAAEVWSIMLAAAKGAEGQK